MVRVISFSSCGEVSLYDSHAEDWFGEKEVEEQKEEIQVEEFIPSKMEIGIPVNYRKGIM